MEERIALAVLQQAPFGYAYHKVLFNDRGEATDYLFLDVNTAFEEMIGLKKNAIIGERVIKVLQKIRKDSFDWASFYDKLSVYEEKQEFVRYSELLKRWYKAVVLAPEKTFLVTIFQDITSEMQQVKMLEAQKQLRESTTELDTVLKSTQTWLTSLTPGFEHRKIQEEMLWLENQRFKALVNSTEDIIFELDLQQRYRAIYGRWIKKEGFKPGYFLGKSARDLYGQQQAAIHEEANLKALAGQSIIYEWSIEINNKLRYYQTSLSPIWNRKGEVSGIVGIGREITPFIKLHHKLQEEKELIQVTFKSIGEGLVTTDEKGNIKLMNNIAEKITGWSEEEAKGRPFADVFKFVNEVTGQKVENPVSKVFKKGKIASFANNTVLITKNGQQIPVVESAAPIKNEKGQIFGIVVVFRDVSEERKQQKKILYMSYHDSLTGLYNRRFIEETIRRLDIYEHLPLSVIMGDVNGLKLTNDVFGHQAGDELLIKAAEIIKKSCRREDIVVRWGGDEFLAILLRTPGKIAEKIINRIKNQCLKDCDGNMQVSIALGWAEKTNEEESIRQVMKEAEEWMYREKLIQGKSFRNDIIKFLTAILFEKSQETKEHVERLKNYCLALGQELDLSSKELDELVLLVALHDIGKVSINEKILKKSGVLTSEEWEEMKKHPEIGFRIAQNTPELSSVAEFILSHHEYWDGKGYPRGIKGKDIPLLSRILAVVDAYDALTNDRTYREVISREEAIAEIKRNAGTQFDPKVVEKFIGILAE